jgi:hypothetical protein
MIVNISPGLAWLIVLWLIGLMALASLLSLLLLSQGLRTS